MPGHDIVWSKPMGTALAQKVRDRLAELFPDSKTANFAQKARQSWIVLCDEINAEFGSSVTVEQCKEKYKNLKKQAKSDYQKEKKYVRGTGGGGPDVPGSSTVSSGSEAYNAIVETFKDTAKFEGVPHGISTQLFPTKTKTSSEIEILHVKKEVKREVNEITF